MEGPKISSRDFYTEYHGHTTAHLGAALPALLHTPRLAFMRVLPHLQRESTKRCVVQMVAVRLSG